VYGGAVFGVGFGIGATCPGITVAAIATGAWWGGVVLLGILGGLWLRGRAERHVGAVHARRSPLSLPDAPQTSPGTGTGGR